VQTSDWISRSGGAGLFANAKVLNAAFGEDLIKQGVNSELIEPEKDRMQAVVLRVLDHRDASVKPLEEVRDQVVSALQQERARQAALAAAQEMSKRLAAGASLADVAADLSVERSGPVTRDERTVPKPVRDLAFTLPHPAEGAVSAGAAATEDGAALVVIAKVVDGNSEGLADAARGQQADALAESIGSQDYRHLVEDLESRAKIERKALAERSSLE
jgi:peptidyl-prolyl cis-trans isomerase D